MEVHHGSMDFSANMYRELSMTNLCSLEETSADVAAGKDQCPEAENSSSSHKQAVVAAVATSTTHHSPSSSISFPAALHIDITPDHKLSCNSSPRDESRNSTTPPAAASEAPGYGLTCSTTTAEDAVRDNRQEDDTAAASSISWLQSCASDCAARIHETQDDPSPVAVMRSSSCEETISPSRNNRDLQDAAAHDDDDEDETSCSCDSISIQDPWSCTADAAASDEENVVREQRARAAAAAAASQLHAAALSRCSVVRTRRSWSQPASPVATKAYRLTSSPGDGTMLFSSGPLPLHLMHSHVVVGVGGGGGSPRIHDPAVVFTATASSPILPTTRRSGNYGLFRTRSTSRVNPGRIHNILEPVELGRCSSLPRHGEIEEEEEEIGWSDFAAQEAAPAVTPGRYFDALEGPELEKPKESENLLLPSDELWPFLLRFPIGVFRISLGLGCQSILWRDLHELRCMQSFFVYVPYVISESIWWLALATLLLLTVIYVAKCVVYFEAVRREFYHPVRVNYFFSPWITALFLAQTVPQYLSFTTKSAAAAAAASSTTTPPLQLSVPSPALWCVVMAPIVALELKLYGQWLSGGERRLSKVANPSTHMSVVGNFVGAKVAVLVGWREAAILFWAVGLAHYLVLFVTLYQRLPTNVVLPREMHPVYFLFVAVPCSASVAWRYITGRFGSLCKIFFFISLFLYSSLGVRFNFFRGCRFSILWWAYTFPMSVAAIAAIQYSKEVTSPLTEALALMLSLIASIMVLLLFIFTILHAFVWKSLFPNDMAIAITATKHKDKVGKSKQSSNSSSHAAAAAADKELLNPNFLINVGTEFGIKKESNCRHLASIKCQVCGPLSILQAGLMSGGELKSTCFYNFCLLL